MRASAIRDGDTRIGGKSDASQPNAMRSNVDGMEPTNKGRASGPKAKAIKGLTLTLKVPEAAALARCGERSIRLAIKEGRIPIVHLGRRNFLISRPAFLNWLITGGEHPHA